MHLSNLGVVKKHVEKVDRLGVGPKNMFGNDDPKTQNTWMRKAKFAGNPFGIFLVDPHEIVCR